MPRFVMFIAPLILIAAGASASPPPLGAWIAAQGRARAHQSIDLAELRGAAARALGPGADRAAIEGLSLRILAAARDEQQRDLQVAIVQAQGLSDAKQRLRAVIAQTDAAIAACNGAAPDRVCTEKASTDLPSLLGQAKPRAGKHKKDRSQIRLLLPDPPTPAQLELFRGKIATDLASVSDLADQIQAALQVELLQHRAFETALPDAGR